jgi:HlyD family secretion protein
VGRVQVGQRASFTVDSFPGRSFTGEVVQVRKAPQVLQNVVPYDVVVSAQNNELKLLPGMTANVRIITDQKDSVLKVPNSALRFRPAGLEDRSGPRPAGPGAGPAGGPRGGGLAGRVWIVDPGGKPQPLQVQLGVSDGTFTEVLGGLKDGQDVIVGQSVPADRPGQPGAGPRLRL